MKKISRVILLFALLFMQTNLCKSQAFEKGQNSVSVGYGFVTFISALKSAYNNGDIYENVKFKSLGPVYLKFEHAISDKIGLGLNVAYAKNEINYKYDSFETDASGNPIFYTEKDKRSTYSILARINWHFGESETFDPYFGVGLGYRDAKWTFDSNDPNGTSAVSFKTLVPLGFEFTLGARYLFSDNIGVYAEVGAAKSVFQVGLVGKF